MLPRITLLPLCSVLLFSCNRPPSEPPSSDVKGPVEKSESTQPRQTTKEEAKNQSAEAKPGSIWISSWSEAKRLATETKRDLLIDFTGSDWCRYCIALKSEVFDQAIFKEEAVRSFVPVEIDFPMDDTKLSQALANQNAQLQREFAVEGYPTVFLADAAGKPYARTGYEEGGPEAYLKRLAGFREIRMKRDTAFQRATGLEGVQKAAALKEGLDEMSESIVLGFYQDRLKEIRELDQQDTLGLEAKFGFRAAFDEFRGQLEKRKSEGLEVMERMTNEFIAKRAQATGAQKQQVLLCLLNYLTPPKDDAIAAKIMEQMRDLDPNSESGRLAAENLERLKQRMNAEAAKTPKEGGAKGEGPK